jgi:hypothetical protein
VYNSFATWQQSIDKEKASMKKIRETKLTTKVDGSLLKGTAEKVEKSRTISWETTVTGIK